MAFWYYPTNVTTMQGLMQYGGYVTNDLLGIFLSFVVFMVVFMALGQFPKHRSFATASFFAFTTSAFLWAFGASGATSVLATFCLMLGSAIYLFYAERE